MRFSTSSFFVLAAGLLLVLAGCEEVPGSGVGLVPVPPEDGAPEVLPGRIVSSPGALTFYDREDAPTAQTVALRNLGGSRLQIFRYDIAGSLPGARATHDRDAHGEISRERPFVLAPYDPDVGSGANQLELEISLEPDGVAQSGTLIVYSDDPETPTLYIDLRLEVGAPCLEVPAELDFGRCPPGEECQLDLSMRNCGTNTLRVTQLEPGQNTSNPLGNQNSLFQVEAGRNAEGVLDAPLVLQRGATQGVVVSYAPLEEGVHHGSITVHSNDPLQPEATIDLVGRGGQLQCPLTDVRAWVSGTSTEPATEVFAMPLMQVMIDGRWSSDPDGHVVRHEFDLVEQPDGSGTSFTRTDPTNPNVVSLFIDLGGEYRVRATAYDDDGVPSCEPVEIVIRQPGAGELPITDARAWILGSGQAPSTELDAAPGDVIVVDSRWSSDPDGQVSEHSVVVYYEHRRLGYEHDPSSLNTAQVQVDMPGTYTIYVTAYDNDGYGSAEPSVIEVRVSDGEQ